MRILDPGGGNSGAGGTTGGGGSTPTTNWIDARWNPFTDPGNNGAVSGLELIAYTDLGPGPDPANSDSWVMASLTVASTETRLVFPLKLGVNANIYCAIRTVYANGAKSSWAPWPSFVTVVP